VASRAAFPELPLASAQNLKIAASLDTSEYTKAEGMIEVMLRLLVKNPVSDQLAHMAPYPHLSPDFPLKPRIEPRTAREFQIVCLPQEDGSFVASVVEAPEILVYVRSRKAAEEKATKRFLKTPDLHAYERHPLATTSAVTVEMEYDEDAKAHVTYVKELRGISTFGDTESLALANTAEMIRGYIKSMEANGKKIPLSVSRLAELKRVVGLR
jgi:predicted RNase H-like HicB family nuclease